MVKVASETGVPWDREPDFINDMGIQWWDDDYMTEYAQGPDQDGVVLQADCYFVKDLEGEMTRIMVSRETGQILGGCQTIEGMAAKIDILKMIEK